VCAINGGLEMNGIFATKRARAVLIFAEMGKRRAILNNFAHTAGKLQEAVNEDS
jgi:hypothetical protein